MNNYVFSKGFASGADISWLPMMEATGFKFRDSCGAEKDFFTILKGYGMNAVRLRAWVSPSVNPYSGHCSTEETLQMGLRAKQSGFDAMIDFHYGDTWCDPGKQVKPAAWKDLPFDGLVEALYDYTREAMGVFVSNGLVPKWVQLGNEINPGMLLPDGSIVNFGKLVRLINAGHKAVKEVSPSTLTMVHLAEGNNTEFCKSFYDALAQNGCTYDLAGLSYYPYHAKRANAEIIDDLAATIKLIPERYDKDVMIVEVGGVDAEEDESYELLVSVIERCHAEKRCTGFFYWEPQGARVWSNYPLSAWRADGTPTRAMDAYYRISIQA